MERFSYVIKNKEGLHARPAGEILKKAGEFKSYAEIEANGKKAALGSGIFALMALGLKKGDEIELTVSGADEKEAVAAIGALMQKLL